MTAPASHLQRTMLDAGRPCTVGLTGNLAFPLRLPQSPALATRDTAGPERLGRPRPCGGGCPPLLASPTSPWRLASRPVANVYPASGEMWVEPDPMRIRAQLMGSGPQHRTAQACSARQAASPSDDVYCITRSLEMTEMFLLWGRWLRGPPRVMRVCMGLSAHTCRCTQVRA